MERLRLDKWLWAARFYKTRSLACEEIDKGRVQVNGVVAKPARELKAGDSVLLRSGPVSRTVTVLALSDKRGPAPVAADLGRAITLIRRSLWLWLAVLFLIGALHA